MVSVLLFVTLTAGGESLDFGRRAGCAGGGGLFGGGLFGGKRASGYSGCCGPVYSGYGCSGGVPGCAGGTGRFATYMVSDVQANGGLLTNGGTLTVNKNGNVVEQLTFRTQPVSGSPPNATICKVAVYDGSIPEANIEALPTVPTVNASGSGTTADPTRTWTVPTNTLPVPGAVMAGTLKTVVIWAYTSQSPTILVVERLSVRIRVG